MADMMRRPVAVVTGANRGIGREVAQELAQAGFHAVVTARDAAAASAAAREIAAGGLRAEARRLDITDPGSAAALARDLTASAGRLNVLVNNAAAHYDDDAVVDSADLDLAVRAFETNVLGAWRVTNALLPLMRATTAGPRRIVNVSSQAGSLALMERHAPGYSVSKAALNALTRQFAAVLRDEGILVNSVCPGRVATGMTRGDGRPVTVGAASVIWAATLHDDGPTGGFFRHGEPLPW